MEVWQPRLQVVITITTTSITSTRARSWYCKVPRLTTISNSSSRESTMGAKG
jgi:hypothetical protein